MPVKQGREKYVVVLTISKALQLIELVDCRELPLESNPQRPQNKAHAQKIAGFIMENQETWNIPPLTVVADQGFFKGVKNHPIGKLVIPGNATIYPIDGQHRLLAIRILNSAHGKILPPDTQIVIEVFIKLSIPERQDLFVTLNSAKKVPKQIIMGIGQNEHFKLVRRIADETGFKAIVERERAVIPKQSLNAYTLSHLYAAIMGVCGSLLFDKDREVVTRAEELILRVADLISNSIKAYTSLKNGDYFAKDEYLLFDPYFFQAIFQAVFEAIKIWEIPSNNIAGVLSQIDWRRFDGQRINPLWAEFLLPLPHAKFIKQKKNKDQVIQIILSKLMGTI